MRCPEGQVWNAKLNKCIPDPKALIYKLKKAYGDSTIVSLKEKSGVNFPNYAPSGTKLPNKSSGTNFPAYKPKKLTKEQQEAQDKSNQYKKGGIAKTAAWTRKEGKDPKGGLNAKGVASYRAANPGSKLKMAVTTKPSKLKAGSKDAKRRKSFCARMSGMPGPAKKPNGEPSRKTLALRKWNC
jgi:hypothetical protein